MSSLYRHNGFTIIETMTVIALLGICLAIIIPNYQVWKERNIPKEYHQKQPSPNKSGQVETQSQIPKLEEYQMSDGTLCVIYNSQLSCGYKR